MAFLGRFKLGQYVPIPVAVMQGEEPALPTSAPVAAIYQGQTKSESKLLPIIEPGAVEGFFVYQLFLGFGYSVNYYNVAIQYKVGSSAHIVTHHFEIVSGGHINGAVVSMTFYDRPQADFVVEKLDGGFRSIGRNPRGT